MLQERYQRCSHRYDLCGRHVHILNALGTDQYRLAVFTGRHQFTRQRASIVLGEQGTIDAVAICGYYALLAMVLNSQDQE